MFDLDTALFLWINSLVGAVPLVDRFFFWAMNDYLIPVALSLLSVGLWFSGSSEQERERHQRGVLVAALGLLLVNLLIREMNQVYFRPRPFVDHEVKLLFYKPPDPSFPSNATAVGFAIAAGLGFANKRVGALAYIMAVTLGITRIYGGVHYPLDVLVGALIGYGSSYLVRAILPYLEPLPTWLLKIGRKVHLA